MAGFLKFKSLTTFVGMLLISISHSASVAVTFIRFESVFCELCGAFYLKRLAISISAL